MAKKTELQLTDRHHTSLGDIIEQANIVVVFGKIVKDLQSQQHGFAQVFGFKRNNVCSRLPSPVVLGLPDPDGPADDCGWDPREFVMWRLPVSFVSTQLHIQPVTIDRALSAVSIAGLTAAQISAIVSASLRAVTGSSQPLISSRSLQSYGIFTSQQLAQLSSAVGVNVARNGFTLDPNALASLGPSSTIADLESAIFDGAKPNA
jgi:hypothetical protein